MNVAMATAYTEKSVQAMARMGGRYVSGFLRFMRPYSTSIPGKSSFLTLDYSYRFGFEAPCRIWLRGMRQKSAHDTLKVQKRGMRYRTGRSEERRLEKMREEAERYASSPETQAAYLRELGKVAPEEVVRRVERGRFARSEPVGKAYLTALVESGRLERKTLPEVLEKFIGREQHAGRGFLEKEGMSIATEEAGYHGLAARNASRGQFGRGSVSRSRMQSDVAGVSDNNPVFVKVIGGEKGETVGKYAKTAKAGRGILTSLAAMGILYYFFLQDRALMKGFGIVSEPNPEPDMGDLKTFDDVRGCDEAKEELKELVDYLRTPKKFTRLGGKLPKGLLLVGPPGTGKTLLAKAVAGEAKRPFFYASGSEFEEMFVGVGARRVRDLFAAAKRHAPCIVFIDEIDAVGAKRNPKDQKHMKMTLNQLLVELDGFNPSDGIIVIAATNIPETLDKALIRPGRFDRHVTVPNPDVRGREEILQVHTKKIPLGKDVNLKIIARGTPGFSGADLANLANTAALRAALENAENVTMKHMEYAKDKILMGAERKSAVISARARLLTAYHEGGHALIAIQTDGAHPVHKATIVPRGPALGMVSQLPDEDIVSMSRRQMLAQLDICMGGRAAEELIFGHDFITSGAQSDFQTATRVAEAMVTRYGMSEKLGKVVYDGIHESAETRALIEVEMRKLLDTAYENAMRLLTENRAQLDNLANALLEMETLTGDEIKLAASGDLPLPPPDKHGLPQRGTIPRITDILQGTQVEVQSEAS